MLDDAPNLNFLRTHALAEALYRAGVEWCCIAPGSRSAPLAWALEDHPKLKTVVHFDERGLAFHALGIAAASDKPAVFVCTSGTAVANALPAVVEASHSRIPLLLLTADRPPEMHGMGMNQTIEQHGIYGGFVRVEDELPFDLDDVDATTAILDRALEAVRVSRRAVAGPVHLNVPLREPLEPSTDPAFDAAPHIKAITAWFDSHDMTTEPVEESFSLPEEVADILSNATRGVVMLGQLRTDAEREAARRVAEHLDWPVYADITSSFRTGGLKQTIPFYSRLTLGGDPKAIEANALLHLGGAVVAKNLPVPLAENTPCIRVAHAPQQLNPWQRATHLLDTGIAAFADSIADVTPAPVDTEWRDNVQKRSATVSGIIAEHCEGEDAFPDEIVFVRSMLKALPGNTTLFLGNSMPVRDADWYASGDFAQTDIAANRGASGIDGNIATALGYARASERPVAVLIGDLTLMHDLNSLALGESCVVPSTIYVINNRGGGIFSMLPIANHSPHFERICATPHQCNLISIADMWNWSFDSIALTELPNIRTSTDMAASRQVVEFHSTQSHNAESHRALNAAIRDALNAL